MNATKLKVIRDVQGSLVELMLDLMDYHVDNPKDVQTLYEIAQNMGKVVKSLDKVLED